MYGRIKTANGWVLGLSRGRGGEAISGQTCRRAKIIPGRGCGLRQQRNFGTMAAWWTAEQAALRLNCARRRETVVTTQTVGAARL